MPKVRRDASLFGRFPNSLFSIVDRRAGDDDKYISVADCVDNGAVQCALEWMRDQCIDNNDAQQRCEPWWTYLASRYDAKNMRDASQFLGLEQLVDDCNYISRRSAYLFAPHGPLEFSVERSATGALSSENFLYIEFSSLLARHVPESCVQPVRAAVREARLGRMTSKNRRRDGARCLTVHLEASRRLCVAMLPQRDSTQWHNARHLAREFCDALRDRIKHGTHFCYAVFARCIEIFGLVLEKPSDAFPDIVAHLLHYMSAQLDAVSREHADELVEHIKRTLLESLSLSAWQRLCLVEDLLHRAPPRYTEMLVDSKIELILEHIRRSKQPEHREYGALLKRGNALSRALAKQLDMQRASLREFFSRSYLISQ